MKRDKKEKKNHGRMMKTRLGTRTGQKTLEEEFKRHPNAKECSESKGQFGTFGVSNGIFRVPNSTLKGSNFHVLGFGPTAFR